MHVVTIQKFKDYNKKLYNYKMFQAKKSCFNVKKVTTFLEKFEEFKTQKFQKFLFVGILPKEKI